MPAEQVLTNTSLDTIDNSRAGDLIIGTIVVIQSKDIKRPAVVVGKNYDFYDIEYVYSDTGTLKPIQNVTRDKLKATVYNKTIAPIDILQRLQRMIQGDDQDIPPAAYRRGGSRKSKRRKSRRHKKTNHRRRKSQRKN